LPLALMVSVS